MYLPQHFQETRPAVLQALLRAHPLGLLVTQDADGLTVADALPFLWQPGANSGSPGSLVGHVARANPLWQSASVGRPVLVVFQGPSAYVSPSGYPSKAEHGKVVPTWNYAMVQARGTLRVIDAPAAALALVSRLTRQHEAALPKPWAVGDAPEDYIAAMLRAIVAIEIPLTSLVGKYKLSQNRSAADRQGVVANLQAGSAEAQDMAAWMQQPPGDTLSAPPGSVAAAPRGG